MFYMINKKLYKKEYILEYLKINNLTNEQFCQKYCIPITIFKSVLEFNIIGSFVWMHTEWNGVYIQAKLMFIQTVMPWFIKVVAFSNLKFEQAKF